MAALQGLKGLYADPQDTTDIMDEGVLEARANPPVADHADYGSQANGYSGLIPLESPFAGMTVYDGYDAGFSAEYGGMGYRVAGQEQDLTPTTHASPYPRAIIQQSWADPDALARYNEQAVALHGPDLGGQRFYNGNSMTGHEEETHYTTNDYVAPNQSILSKVEGQLRAEASNSASGRGGGNADPDQGYGVMNTLPEFNAGHSIRREQHDSAHFDYTNTHGEQNVPFMGRHPVEQMPLDGPDSPYFQQGDIDGSNTPWEGRIGDPTPYAQPAEPTIAPAPSQDTDIYAWSY